MWLLFLVPKITHTDIHALVHTSEEFGNLFLDLLNDTVRACRAGLVVIGGRQGVNDEPCAVPPWIACV